MQKELLYGSSFCMQVLSMLLSYTSFYTHAFLLEKLDCTTSYRVDGF